MGAVRPAQARERKTQPAVSDPDLKAAKALFTSAQAHFAKKEYDLAAVGFLAAYERKPLPAFLFNAAVAREKGRQLEPAKKLFERYLALDPKAGDAPQVKARIAALEAKLAPSSTPAPGAPVAGTAAVPERPSASAASVPTAPATASSASPATTPSAAGPAAGAPAAAGAQAVGTAAAPAASTTGGAAAAAPQTAPDSPASGSSTTSTTGVTASPAPAPLLPAPAPVTLAPQVIWQSPTSPAAASTAKPAPEPSTSAGATASPREATVHIDSSPPGAAVYIGDRSQGPVGNTPWKGTLEPHPTKIIVEAQGYKPDERTITPTVDKVTQIYVTLAQQPSVGWVEIGCNVPGTPVYLDDRSFGVRGVTPFRANLKVGKHAVILERPGYKPATREIEVTGGEATQVVLTLERTTSAYVEVHGSTTQGAQVLVGEGVGACTAPCRLEVPAGRHLVRVQRDGMKEYSAELDFTAATEKQLDVQLATRPSRTGAWAALAVSAAMIGSGAIVGLLSNSERNAVQTDINAGAPVTSDDSRIHTGKVEAIAADILMVGGAVVGLALALPSLLSSGPDSQAHIQDRSLDVAPVPMPGGAGVGAGWRF